MSFEFATAGRILFGNGITRKLGSLVKEFGQRALLVIGIDPSSIAPVISSLRDEGIGWETFPVNEEPTIDLVQEGIDQAKRWGCTTVIAIGGGSSIDTGKAIAALLVNEGDFMDYLEVIGKGQPLRNPSLPFIAVPTTAGTGAEVTRNAVLASLEHRVKVSLRSPSMLPRLAIVDPELTYGLPPHLTASTGMDALTQVLEPFVSNKANPMTDGLCREGLARAARSLYRAYEHGEDKEAREDMCIVSLFGGLALANAKLGAVHGIAAVLGGMMSAPHGAMCARLLPFVMETNIAALIERDPNSEALNRYDQIGRMVSNDNNANAQDGAKWVAELCELLLIPSLNTYGLAERDFPEVIERAKLASSMQGNPIRLTDTELMEILRKAW